MPELQPRLEPDVAALVKKMGGRNGRSVPGEVNFVLRRYYERESLVEKSLDISHPSIFTPTHRRLRGQKK